MTIIVQLLGISLLMTYDYIPLEYESKSNFIICVRKANINKQWNGIGHHLFPTSSSITASSPIIFTMRVMREKVEQLKVRGRENSMFGRLTISSSFLYFFIFLIDFLLEKKREMDVSVLPLLATRTSCR